MKARITAAVGASLALVVGALVLSSDDPDTVADSTPPMLRGGDDTPQPDDDDAQDDDDSTGTCIAAIAMLDGVWASVGQSISPFTYDDTAPDIVFAGSCSAGCAVTRVTATDCGIEFDGSHHLYIAPDGAGGWKITATEAWLNDGSGAVKWTRQ